MAMNIGTLADSTQGLVDRDVVESRAGAHNSSLSPSPPTRIVDAAFSDETRAPEPWPHSGVMIDARITLTASARNTTPITDEAMLAAYLAHRYRHRRIRDVRFYGEGYQ
jgi:hypothetical protein